MEELRPNIGDSGRGREGVTRWPPCIQLKSRAPHVTLHTHAHAHAHTRTCTRTHIPSCKHKGGGPGEWAV